MGVSLRPYDHPRPFWLDEGDGRRRDRENLGHDCSLIVSLHTLGRDARRLVWAPCGFDCCVLCRGRAANAEAGLLSCEPQSVRLFSLKKKAYITGPRILAPTCFLALNLLPPRARCHSLGRISSRLPALLAVIGPIAICVSTSGRWRKHPAGGWPASHGMRAGARRPRYRDPDSVMTWIIPRSLRSSAGPLQHIESVPESTNGVREANSASSRLEREMRAVRRVRANGDLHRRARGHTAAERSTFRSTWTVGPIL